MILKAKLVEFEDISQNLNHPELHLFDVRWYLDGRNGYESYRSRHIRSAIFLDLEDHLTSRNTHTPQLGRHPLPSPDDFANYLTSHGVKKDDTLIFYDDQANSVSARAWWMASSLGFNAALLNGGLNGADQNFLESGDSPRKRSLGKGVNAYKLDWDPHLTIDEKGLKSALADERCILLDARSNDRYHGTNETVDPKAGHIPGARNLFWMLNVDELGRFKTNRAIADNFRSVGINDNLDQQVISSCGSGITACHNIFSLLLSTGIESTLYPPSFSGWCRNNENPIEL